MTSGLEISVQTQEKMREHWASFGGDLKLIFLNINRQMCFFKKKKTDSLHNLELILIQKVFQRRINILPAKSHVCCWKKNGDKKSVQNTHSKPTLMLATKIELGWATWAVDPVSRTMTNDLMVWFLNGPLDVLACTYNSSSYSCPVITELIEKTLPLCVWSIRGH